VPYTVEFLRTADEELARFPLDVQRRIVARIERLKDNPRPAGVKQLESAERFLRLRVGDYRVVYMIEGKDLVVLIVKVGHRKDIYDNLAALRQRVERWRRGRPRQE
jgi:mRNA interferase RelE/StbE